MRRAALSLCILLAAAPAAVAVEALDEARRLLSQASLALDAARGDEARLAAVSRAVDAHEGALAALRAGLRRIATEEREITRSLAEERDRLGALVSALQSLGRAPRVALLAYPDGPLRAARAGSLMASVTPELDRRIGALRARLDRLALLRRQEREATTAVRETLGGLQQLRAQGMRALRRQKPVASAAALEAAAAAAGARSRDLGSLAAAIEAGLSPRLSPARFSERKGRLDLPVAGRISAGFGEPDPWGRSGTGMALTAPAYAQVTAPWDGTVRYAGPLTGYGPVLVLEPQAGWLIVLAGLGRIDRTVGETVLAGERLGDLGGPLPTSEEFLLEAVRGDGQIAAETLYVEIREQGRAVDPAAWFDTSAR